MNPVISKYSITAGTPDRLGAHADARGVNFAIFSTPATKIELCLFDDSGQETRIPLPARTGDIWHGHVEGLKPGQAYGYRVHGPYEPAQGHLCNPHKLLLDPYARDITNDFIWHESHYGYDRTDPAKPDTTDNAAYMMKARVPAPAAPSSANKPHTPWPDTIIYEAHLRGFTKTFPGLPEHLRGTCAGLADESVAAYLKNLGITAIELLPVHAAVPEPALIRRGLTNYWGYNSIGFFAPSPGYLAGGRPGEFRAMVDRFHASGIEVILDVVFNHTAEGDHTGPTLSFRGIDNASYYRPAPHDKSRYEDVTGCGNTLNTDHPQVRRLILDSLRYWAEDMGVDGFRFDLAPALGRENGNYNRESALFQEIRHDPVLSRVKLIAEPWDIGPGGYQLGNLPSGWHEWNDRFRDNLRAWWRGDAGLMGKKADRLAGSRPEFGHKSARPAASINFITAHDGFTLRDLVSYERKHNDANGENNRDGTDHNTSCNYGVEGPSDDPAVENLRQRQTLNMLASLFLSQGTPMLLAGDEFGNTQGGNNNAYCQDNETGWLNWEQIGDAGREIQDFVRALIALRNFPLLRQDSFLNGFNRCAHGIPDILWLGPEGTNLQQADWGDAQRRCIGMMLNEGAAADTAASSGRRLLAIFNAHSHPVDFYLPAPPGGAPEWRRVLDTDQPALRPGGDGKAIAAGSPFRVKARSTAVFIQNPAPSAPAPPING